MTKEKQIEEMIEHVREVTDDCQNCNLYKDRLCDYNCDLCEAIQLACEALYNAGYRKQSEGEWVRRERNPEAMKAFHEMGIGLGMSVNSIYFTCSVCDKWGRPQYHYCPNCGAKMKGGEDNA